MRRPACSDFSDPWNRGSDEMGQCDYEAYDEAYGDYEDDQYDQYLENRGKIQELKDYLDNKRTLDQIMFHLPQEMLDKNEPEIRAFVRSVI